MIVGRGLLASAFDRYRYRNDVVIFASGVSNSQEVDGVEFVRERTKVKESLALSADSLFVYFSTCSIYDSSLKKTPYVRHKVKIEKVIQDSSTSFLIIRLPQVVGYGGNPRTITNYLYNCIVNEKPFEVWRDAVRFLVDIDDVFHYVSYLIDVVCKKDCIINFPGKSSSVLDIVVSFEDLLKKKAKYKLADYGFSYAIPTLDDCVDPLDIGITFGEYYIKELLEKYYC